MSSLRLGLAVAVLAALLWQAGALVPWHAQAATSLDLQWYFLPVYEAFFGALRTGDLLLWNPYQLCGMPWLGTLQGGYFYPPHLVYVFLPAPWGLALCTVLHLGLAAGGTAAFASRAGLSPAASVLAGAVFGLAGIQSNLQLWPYLLEAAAWIPIGALAVLDLTDGRVARGTIVLGLASGMSWLAGSPQATVMAWYAWGALLAARLLFARPSLVVAARAVAGAAGGLAAGILLASVALLPAFELAREGVRRTSALDVGSMYPFGVTPPRGVWRLWVNAGPVLVIAALALAPFALLTGPSALSFWGLAVTMLAITFALGPATPLFELYLFLPGLSWFRIPHRVLIVGQFALAIAAGLGLDSVARRLGWPRLGPVLVPALLAISTVQGVRQHKALPPLYDPHWTPYSAAQREAYARIAATVGDERVWPFSPGLGQYSLYPKLPTLTHLRSIDDYEPLSLRRQHDYFVFLAEGARREPRGSENQLIRSLNPAPGRAAPATRRRLLDLAGVRFLIVLPPTKRRADVAAFVRDAGLVAWPPEGEDLSLYENPRVLPRAFVTYRASRAPAADELLPILARESFDPLAESFVEGDAGLPAAPAAPARGAPATIVRDDPNVVEIEATLAAPGLVVLSDTYYPGWTATVDGVPAQILPTNHLFRGVSAPAGTHRIRFAYRPRSVAIGAVLSLLTGLALAAGAYRLKTRPAA